MTALPWSTLMTSPTPELSRRDIPPATVARLPVYHRVLGQFDDAGVTTVSSEELAQACGVSSAKLRKDLSHLGSYGTRGVGYDVRFLAYQISRELGLTQPWGVVIVGAGNLGQALVAYRGFASRGFAVVGVVDASPALVGSPVGIDDVRVQALDRLEQVIAAADARIGVIAVPAEAAQDVADRLVAAGIRSILNFAPVVLSVPADVEVRKVDLAVELQILAFHEQRREDNAIPVAPRLLNRRLSTTMNRYEHVALEEASNA
jgi:redox-sensing transcriptional repressor